ncbi:PKD domain-containing protein [Mariniflexile sp.]|uniref:PKD domain-containing protein n=1 Tax=Mariniflexile sp. TaxID=1979402 RepID=UPI0040477073
MKTKAKFFLGIISIFFTGILFASFSIPEKEYRIFQFPKNMVPRIDGDFSDWDIVPDSYSIGLDQLMDTKFGRGADLDPKDYDIQVKVGWVKDLNRLYFYVEAYDDYWDFEDKGLKQDIFEVVVDGNLSGGPLVKKSNANSRRLPQEELYFKGHGAHAQNYHIFTPAKNKDKVMVWGNTPWIKEFPYFNSADNYNFKQGESGTYRMEFWITPFDHADFAGNDRSTETQLIENDIIGLSWCILEYDGDGLESFMNLGHDSRMVFDADFLNTFRLMPLEKKYTKPIQADWSFLEIDRNKRWIQFKDASEGQIEKWSWDFGDGNTSTEQNPSHHYNKGGEWTVVLTVFGPEGKSVRSKVWDVVTK